jgi:hypothetical protein
MAFLDEFFKETHPIMCVSTKGNSYCPVFVEHRHVSAFDLDELVDGRPVRLAG